MRLSLLLFLILWLGEPVAGLRADDDIRTGEWHSVGEASNVSYVVRFILHDVVGRSEQIRVAAAVDADDGVEVDAAVPVAGFDSSNSRRDRDMRDTVDADTYPLVRFSGEGRLCAFEDDRCVMEFHGTVTFAGVERAVAVPVALHRLDDETVRANLSFPILLSEHNVDRPRFLFWRIDDEVIISGTVTMAVREAAEADPPR